MTKPISRKMAVDCLLYLFVGHAVENRPDGVFNVAHSVFLRCYICKQFVCAEQDIQFDHVHAHIFDGPHEYQNLRPVHTECHKKKTARDIKDNAKIKRLLKPKKPKRKMKSKGFDKRFRKKMSGTVEKRS